MNDMGIDALDIIFRIEKAFQIKVPRADMDLIYGGNKSRDQWTEPTAGQIHDRLCELLTRQGKNVPADSWERVQTCIAEGIGWRGFSKGRLQPDDVKRESLLVKDLGCS